MKKSPLSRKDFLKLTWTSLWGLVLAACKIDTEETPSPTPVPTATDIPTPEPKNDSAPVEEEPEPTNTPTETPTETPIPCFKLLTPKDGTTLPEIGKVTFSWEPMPNAIKYEIKFTLPSGQEVVFEVTETSYARYLEAFISGGIYIWQVTAFDEKNALICITEPFRFEKPTYIPPKQNNGGSNNGSGENSQPGHFNFTPGE